MFGYRKDAFNNSRLKQLFDGRNVALYIFALIVLAISWSGAKTIQNNYQLQKQISTLNQQNTVLKLQTENIQLQNQYFQTDQYLDLAARQDLGLAAPGEQILLVPKNVALSYVNQSFASQGQSSSNVPDSRSRYVKNLEDWRDFLLGRRLFSN